METSFATLVHEWLRDKRGDEDLARQLDALSEQAWRSGDPGDRDALLRFISRRKAISLFSFLFEALQCGDRDFEVQAIGYVGALAVEGYDFDDEQRIAIKAFSQRYPDLKELVDYILELPGEQPSRRG
jgi:hypothetical protein